MRQLLLSKVYQLLEPGPVVLLTTAHKGCANVMTMSWHMMVEFEPPLVACVISGANYSFEALRATGECVIAIPARKLANKVVKVGSPDPNVGFISHALKYGDAIAAGRLLAPAKTLGEMRRIVFNDYIDASLAAIFVFVVVATVIYGLISIRRALGNPQPTAMEIGLAGVVAEGRHA